MEELTERRKEILKIIVQEYVETATPVSSESVAKKYFPGLSSATVRNEMAELERLGYITHTHTSAGRIPSDQGYRYFVEHLMDRAALAPTEQRTIRHQFHQIELEFDQWLQLAASVVAQTARNAAVVTAPRAHETRLKHIELISIHDTLALLVSVMQDGTIKEQVIRLDDPATQEDLTHLARKVGSKVVGLPTSKLETTIEGMDEEQREVARYLLDIMRTLDAQVSPEMHHIGIANVLRQPEFLQIERVQQLLEVLEQRILLARLMPQVLTNKGVQIIIGSENSLDEMRQCSVVVARYGVGDEIVGALGVLGPTRMEYGRSISTVSYVATIMSDMLRELYGAA